MLTYVSIPFSHEDSNVVKYRMERFWACMAHLISEEQISAVSPMTLQPMLDLATDLPRNWEYWRTYCTEMMNHCGELIVIKLDGWNISVGVEGEIDLAEKLGLPISYMSPDTFEIESGSFPTLDGLLDPEGEEDELPY